MSASQIPCPKCRAELPEALFNQAIEGACPRCGCAVQCDVFPSFYAAPPVGRLGETLVDASDASCFFHPAKKAAVACESCGRFLCNLCDLDFGGRHVCPNCLSSGRKKGEMKNFDHFRLSWSSVALLVALVPPLALIGFMPFNLGFGIVAIAIALFGLRKPRSLTGRRRYLVFTLTMVIGIGEIVALVMFGGKLMKTFYGV